MYKLSVYGKGGVGKSTVSSNISYLLSKKGLSVLHIGCDPKHDSTRLLTDGKSQKTFLDCMSDKDCDPIVQGSNGISCLECGGAEPGIGCAGKGMSAMFSFIEEHTPENTDIRVCDVLGDVVCGGFGVPMRRANVDGILIVVSEDFMSLYAANNILRGIRNLNGTDCILGLVLNSRYPENAKRIEIFSKATGVPVIGTLSQSRAYANSEARGKTLSELYPDSEPVKEMEVIAEVVLKALSGEYKPVSANPLNDEAMTDVAAMHDVTDTSAPKQRINCSFDTVDEVRGLVYKSNQAMPACTSHGAVHFLHPIQDAAIVLHGPRNCAWLMSYAWERDATHSILMENVRVADNLYSTGMDVNSVFGGDRDALYNTVRKAYDDGFRTVFVVLTCTAETIGTDIQGECERISFPGLRVIPVKPDIRSLISKFGTREGAMAAVSSLMKDVPKEKGAVCLGMMSRIAEDKYDLSFLKELLGAFGLHLKYIFPGKINVEGIEDLQSCEYLIVPSRGFASREVERHFSGNMKILRLEPLMGMYGVREWCSALEKVTGISGKEFIERAEEEYRKQTEPLREELAGKKAVIYERSGMTFNPLIDTIYDLDMDILAYITWPDNFQTMEERNNRYPNIPNIRDIELCQLKEVIVELGADIIISGNPRTGKLGIPWVGAMGEHIGYMNSVSTARKIRNAFKVSPLQAWRR